MEFLDSSHKGLQTFEGSIGIIISLMSLIHYIAIPRPNEFSSNNLSFLLIDNFVFSLNALIYKVLKSSSTDHTHVYF